MGNYWAFNIATIMSEKKVHLIPVVEGKDTRHNRQDRFKSVESQAVHNKNIFCYNYLIKMATFMM